MPCSYSEASSVAIHTSPSSFKGSQFLYLSTSPKQLSKFFSKSKYFRTKLKKECCYKTFSCQRLRFFLDVWREHFLSKNYFCERRVSDTVNVVWGARRLAGIAVEVFWNSLPVMSASLAFLCLLSILILSTSYSPRFVPRSSRIFLFDSQSRLQDLFSSALKPVSSSPLIVSFFYITYPYKSASPSPFITHSTSPNWITLYLHSIDKQVYIQADNL